MVTNQALKEANAKLNKIDVRGKGYVQVNERVKAFRELCPDGSITTDIIHFDADMVVIRATVSDGDKVLATGIAYEKQGSTQINRTSYIENCETSAVGRALGFCGIGIDASMASAEEVATAMKQQNEISNIENKPIGEVRAKALERQLSEKGVSVATVYAQYNVSKLAELNEEQHASIIRRLEKSGGNRTA